MIPFAALVGAWHSERDRRMARFAPRPVLDASGLTLGPQIAIAKAAPDRWGAPSLAVAGNEDRILALLAAAYWRPIGGVPLDQLRRAAHHLTRGNRASAAIHVALAGLGAMEQSEGAAFRLFAAEKLLDAGVLPRELLAGLGLDTGPLDALAKYSPNQPRDDHGRWTDGGEEGDGDTGGTRPESTDSPAHDEPKAGRSTAQPDPDSFHQLTAQHVRFFDQLVPRIRALAQRLGVDEVWLLGLAAYESGYLNDHNQALNNPFGLTHGGKSNLAFSSIEDATSYFERHWGPRVRGASDVDDFVSRLTQPPSYNTRTKKWPATLKNVIDTVRRLKSEWESSGNR